MILGTKAETLRQLEGKLTNAQVLPQIAFTVGDWKDNQALRLENVIDWAEKQNCKQLIVRSSALSEDTAVTSNAGKYESVLRVEVESGAITTAVNKVIASYDVAEDADQVLIQPYLQDVKVSGVSFTLDPNTGGNYYVINYDSTGDTEGVTSGVGQRNSLFYQFKDAEIESDESKPFLKHLILVLRELEVFFQKDNLDVEFAVGFDDAIYVLQVRELCMQVKKADVAEQAGLLKGIRERFVQQQCKKPYLCGQRTIYSVMTDWNPAEMIGITPKPLALSLYKEIITDSVWAYQRDNYGYRNLRSFPLLINLGGCPYIDVRVSFNSFIPAKLDEKTSEKLVNYYLNRLAEHPQEHDKAEFNIVFSCYTFDLPERIQVLKEYDFTADEIEEILEALRAVTNQMIDHQNGLWRKDYEKIATLQRRYQEIVDSNLSDLEKIYWLLEDCKRYGTLPFAGLARAGFVAVELLKSMVSCGILSGEDYESFMNGVESISSQMKHDFKVLPKDAFLDKYGHLRPGTYDIESLRYDENPDFYFDWSNREDEPLIEKKQFKLSLQQMQELRSQVKENGLQNEILELLDFIKKAIEGREYGKYVFSKSLSKVLQLLKNLGYTAEDMSYMDIRTIYDIYASSFDADRAIADSIRKGKTLYQIAETLRLPPVIVNANEIMAFHYPESEPNYITSGRAEGEVVEIGSKAEADDLAGKILLIEGADPGYDWIFSKGISGFVTKFGGANSHMAIRAGELGIPAAIGVGDQLYHMAKEAKVLEINSTEKTIKVIREK